MTAVNTSARVRHRPIPGACLLTSCTALVTGAASDIGRAIALAYARAGARVVATDGEALEGQRTVDLIRIGGGEAMFVACDVTSAEAHETLVRRVLLHYGALHVVCNNAGIDDVMLRSASEPAAGRRRMIEVNLAGVFYGMRAQIPALVAAGGGSIVNVASIPGCVAFASASAYTAAKHGVVGLTNASAAEYAVQGIRINAVGPGLIETHATEGSETRSAARQADTARNGIARRGVADRVAQLVLWLSSPAASLLTGSFHAVDGGSIGLRMARSGAS